MGCFVSKEHNEKFDLAKEADLLIGGAIEENKSSTKTSKILLLGTGDSGKSTILKQLRILHKNGFSKKMRCHYTKLIWQESVVAMVVLIMEARKRGIQLTCDDSENYLAEYRDKLLRYHNLLVHERLSESSGEIELIDKFDVAEAIYTLWDKDEGIKLVYDRINEFQFITNADYFFENVFRYVNRNSMANNEDILKARIRTTGITETVFSISGHNFNIVDCGGQRSERKKWIKGFKGISMVVFVVAISEYDQTLFEDQRINRVYESMLLFKRLINSSLFVGIPFILLFNKIDIFAAKISKSPIRRYFPEFKGTTGSFDQSLMFFQKLYSDLNQTGNPLYFKTTCATDTTTMRFVITAVTDMLICENLKGSGMI